MLPLSPSLSLFPIVHGSAASMLALRRHLWESSYDCIALPWAESMRDGCEALVEQLPAIHALVLRQEGTVAYLPADPCDAYIEAIRQTQASRIALHFIGPEHIPNPRSAIGIPDPWVLEHTDVRAWTLAQWLGLATDPTAIDSDEFFRTVIHNLRNMDRKGIKTLLVCHITEIATLMREWNREEIHPQYSSELIGPMSAELWPIKPQHLYFALGEIPFFAGFFEQNRQDPFALLPDISTLAKNLLLRTRDVVEETGATLKISPARIQATLTYARKLASTENALMPGLFDWVIAAKGTLGDAFARRLLDFAHSYPFDPEEGLQLKLGLDRIRTPLTGETESAWNILRDLPRVWRTIHLRRDPKPAELKKWQHSWDPNRSCSHLPEDIRIERFNARAREQSLRNLQAHQSCTSPFTSSLLDGIDLRETLRHWHKQEIWVKETPPRRGKIDTVVVLFDETHDERYPHRCTWYAEHMQESTLTFYATDPFSDLIGPGIARARYGGLAMLFPPRRTPDLFQIEVPEGLNAAEHLTYASMLYSEQRLVAIISATRPSAKLRLLSQRLGKHLVWTPLSQFKLETLEALRTFHILNGTQIRSIAGRFIGY